MCAFFGSHDESQPGTAFVFAVRFLFPAQIDLCLLRNLRNPLVGTVHLLTDHPEAKLTASTEVDDAPSLSDAEWEWTAWRPRALRDLEPEHAGETDAGIPTFSTTAAVETICRGGGGRSTVSNTRAKPLDTCTGVFFMVTRLLQRVFFFARLEQT